MQGYVPYFNTEKNYGFVRIEAGDFYFDGKDVVGDPVSRAMDVEFWLDDSPKGKGLVAVEVRRKKR